jgi:hypothetical protein
MPTSIPSFNSQSASIFGGHGGWIALMGGWIEYSMGTLTSFLPYFYERFTCSILKLGDLGVAVSIFVLFWARLALRLPC